MEAKAPFRYNECINGCERSEREKGVRFMAKASLPVKTGREGKYNREGLRLRLLALPFDLFVGAFSYVPLFG